MGRSGRKEEREGKMRVGQITPLSSSYRRVHGLLPTPQHDPPPTDGYLAQIWMSRRLSPQGHP